ncbi:signal peptidase I [Sphingomonas sediminicola]|uniref:signal peptidase I n=1 Tax=Sphingomonas sediminicola TaxID=386874 RepID=UPI001FEA13C3|nr:signal peptidase I [Sphingomonas sediminicola]
MPRLIVSVLLLAWVIRSFIFAPFNIPSGSMLPALYIGDYVMVSKWPYGFSRYSFPWGFPSFDGRIFSSLPERGDVVVFRAPGTEEDFIKRVVGLPGDTVEVQGGMLIVNGKPVPREQAGPSRCRFRQTAPAAWWRERRRCSGERTAALRHAFIRSIGKRFRAGGAIKSSTR